MLSMNNEMSASMFEAKRTNDYDEVIFCIKVFILLFKFFLLLSSQSLTP